MKNFFLAFAMLFSVGLWAQDIQLPEAQKEGGMPLMEALNARQSAREFSQKPLTKQELSDLLWAAWGYNRENKRTAPSSMNRQEIQVYLAMADGLFLYDAKGNKLIKKSDADLREASGKQAYVKSAPLNLIYVANYADNAEINAENWIATSSANVGFIAQNVYLYCASRQLATVVRGSFDQAKLSALMGLHPDNRIILTQTVGYPKH